MLTTDEVLGYLAELGLALPSAMVACLVTQVNSLEQCLSGSGLSECSIRLALLQAVAILAINTGARRLKSRSAPSGASQSFDYGSLTEQGKMLRNSIKALGAWDCIAPILPKEIKGSAALMIGMGSRAKGC